ncbi:acetyl-CoA synthetase-like protein [Punctularia strigosozonata HHB-11173 SS5]|uniref:acetyl-CoA synthetase-like protein n=1 Tax=Punctularia strigosozonata (strain HHB-11173) TaxID=741275 RepID=UPI0004418728|nr:acetyl-CoA synthetase-like protein [Punctularia strigosozonata HHB-11173 SS5]EIN08864.1 acetyl-CoA synthetase-like protein [Punctularia strigosozonata HHB-11173 SS5]
MGVKKGERVAVIMGNNSAYACLQWACVKIGAVLVTINPAYRVHELINTLRIVDVSHLFLVPRIRSSNYIQMLLSSLPSLSSASAGEIQDETLPALRNVIVMDDSFSSHGAKDAEGLRSMIDFRETLVWAHGSEEAEVKARMSSLAEHDVINMQYTSGTTGSPKAVCLTHHNLLNNALSIGRCMQLGPGDVVCNVPPLFHCFGLILGNLAAWTHGSCIVYPSPVFDPPRIVDALIHERCTALHGVPTHFLGVLSEVEKRRDMGEAIDTSSLRTGIAAGSSIPIGMMRRMINELNLTGLTIAYGMTETSPVSFQTTLSDPLEKRVETVGKIQPHVKAKLVDLEGNVVPIGKPGELLVAGYLLQTQYWGDEEQTRRVMKRDEEGTLWMHTGDEGIMDEEGYLRIVGRIKDIIIRGGENLFPVQIENVLTSHPAILEGAAIAVPDPVYGEVVGAWVVRNPHSHTQISRDEVRMHVSRGMNPQNAPAWVWVVGEDTDEAGNIIQELPKTASGKVQKHILRAWSKELARRGIGRVQSPQMRPEKMPQASSGA